MSIRFRNGLHKLNKSICRRCNRSAASRLPGARSKRRPDDLRLLCRVLTQYLRLARRMEKRDPHLFGPRARDYYLDTLRLEQRDQEVEAALRKIYGPRDPGAPARVSTLWSDRYPEFSSASQHRLFLKWFHEQYPSP